MASPLKKIGRKFKTITINCGLGIEIYKGKNWAATMMFGRASPLRKNLKL